MILESPSDLLFQWYSHPEEVGFIAFLELLRQAQQHEGTDAGLEFVYAQRSPSGGPYDLALIPFRQVAERVAAGRAELLAKKGASGCMQRPLELVPILTDPQGSLGIP